LKELLTIRKQKQELPLTFLRNFQAVRKQRQEEENKLKAQAT
jgi:hypothetical protein